MTLLPDHTEVPKNSAICPVRSAAPAQSVFLTVHFCNQIIRGADLQRSGLQEPDCFPEQQAAINEGQPLSPRLQ